MFYELIMPVSLYGVKDRTPSMRMEMKDVYEAGIVVEGHIYIYRKLIHAINTFSHVTGHPISDSPLPAITIE